MFIVANQSVFKLIICSSHLKDISSNFTKTKKKTFGENYWPQGNQTHFPPFTLS